MQILGIKGRSSCSWVDAALLGFITFGFFQKQRQSFIFFRELDAYTPHLMLFLFHHFSNSFLYYLLSCKRSCMHFLLFPYLGLELSGLKAIIINVLQSSNSLQTNPIGLILQMSDPCRSRPTHAIEIIIIVFHFLFQNGVS